MCHFAVLYSSARQESCPAPREHEGGLAELLESSEAEGTMLVRVF